MNLHYSPLEEGNVLIAEFMGWQEYKLVRPSLFSRKKKMTFRPRGRKMGFFDIFPYIGAFKYHSSWDWLMPVVEKIEKMGYDSRIHGNNNDGGFICDFVDNENNEWGCAVTQNTKIETVWLAIIDFIKYYNEQNLQP